MKNLHSLLRRQIKRFLGPWESVPAEWKDFMAGVDAAYRESDDDRNMLERALELSSQELLEANSELRAIFQAFPDLVFRLDAEGRILDYKAGGTADSFGRPGVLGGKRIYGVPETRVGQMFREAIDDIRARRAMVSIEYPMKGGHKMGHYEARLLPFLENQIIVIIRVANINGSGGKGTAAAAADITLVH